jgi:hypothetical protein
MVVCWLTTARPDDLLREAFVMAHREGLGLEVDSLAMGSRRFGEPVREYLQAVGGRAALIFWGKDRARFS